MQYPHVFLRTAAVFSAIAAFFSIPWTLAGANISLLCLVLTWLLAGGLRQRWDVARGNAVTLPLLALYAIILLGAAYTTAPWRVVLDHWLKYDKLLLMVIAISLLAGLQVLATLDNRNALAAFTGPQLHLLAEQDALVSAAVANDLLALLPVGEVDVLEGCGHAVVIEQPQALAALMLDFIREANDADA